MPSRDPQIWVEARRRLPLPALMAKIGDGDYAKREATCPFCEHKKKFGIFLSNGRHKFKCHRTSCVANEPEFGRNEIGYLALRQNLSLKQAQQEYLKLAVPESYQEPPPPREPRRVVPVEFGSHEPQAEPAPEPESSTDPREGKPKNVWHDLWQRLILNAKDRAEIREKRGLSDETIDRAGIRSNNEGNVFHLEALAQTYTESLLVSEGIFKAEHRRVRPSGQLFGYGLTNRKGEDGKPLKGPDGKVLFEITEPPLIPYFNLAGVPFHIRPHKGHVKKPQDELAEIVIAEDEDEARTCSGHPYAPPDIAELVELNDGLVIFTEGEWKALACAEVGLAAIACPGITFIRNPAFRKELLALLAEVGASEMVVIFDNEDKGNPAFKGRFVADPFKRWETQVYAEIAAYEVKEYFAGVGGSCRIGMLPDKYREEGKADFDGILATLVKQHGRADGNRAARKVFLDAVHDASDKPTADLFPTESRRIIECRREQIFHVPLVSIGGDAELKMARRFAQVNPKTGLPVDAQLAALYRSLPGCYYQRKKPKPNHPPESSFEEIAFHIEELKQSKDTGTTEQLTLAYAAQSALWERRKGLPEPISDFTLVCEFQLRTVGSITNRLVRLRNKRAKGTMDTTLYELAPENIERCSNFRRWCYGVGEYTWKGGEIALQELIEDANHHSHMRTIIEVDIYGWHPEYKVWFFGDCAFTPEGVCIHADDRKIFWHEGIGYQVTGNRLERGTPFAQGPPLMLKPQQGASILPPLENPDLGKMFSQVALDLHDTIGGHDGWLALGMMFAYAIAPELMREGGHPSLFMYGPMSGGKTTIMRWLVHIWGFPALSGTGIDSRTTPVGISRSLSQYSCLPFWFDEYRKATVNDEKEAVLRGAFDRGHGEKGIASPNKRTQSVAAMTTPTITGENSSRDAATRSRYGHVMVSENRRIGDAKARFDRVQEECRHYYLLGRYIMEHRPEYLKQCLAVLDGWMTAQDIAEQIVNKRVRFVHGVAFSAFVVLAQMLGVEDEAGNTAFMRFLAEHGRKALVDVVEEGFLNTFWREVLSLLGREGHVRKHFVAEYRLLHDDGALAEAKDGRLMGALVPGAIHVLYVAPGSLYGAYEKDMRSRGKEPPHSESDLRRELEKETYWLPAPRNKVRVHRKSINGTKTSCWAISLERAQPKPGSDEETDDGGAPYLFPFAEEFISALEKPDAEGR